jgi:hypothetical protein
MNKKYEVEKMNNTFTNIKNLIEKYDNSTNYFYKIVLWRNLEKIIKEKINKCFKQELKSKL